MNSATRRHFDEIVEAILDELPDHLVTLLDEVPLIIEDEPSRRLLRELGLDPADEDLCGLHSGVALTDRSVERDADMPEEILLFRGPIIRLAQETPGATPGTPADEELRRQIKITLLHEIGHHFGLDEDDLEKLGYG